jgi:acetylornithine deacetylase/succinyl-diaminopimelate desuccinylase-like protein
VTLLADCLREVGLDPTPTAFVAATDLAWYGERRLPGIICGPGSLAQCHVAGEYIETRQLLLASQVYAQMLVEWSG